jgi:hypothetical protein
MQIKFTQDQIEQLETMGFKLDGNPKTFNNINEVLEYANYINKETLPKTSENRSIPRTYREVARITAIMNSILTQTKEELEKEIKLAVNQRNIEKGLQVYNEPTYVAFIDTQKFQDIVRRNKDIVVETMNVLGLDVLVTSWKAEVSANILIENKFGI